MEVETPCESHDVINLEAPPLLDDSSTQLDSISEVELEKYKKVLCANTDKATCLIIG